MSSRRDIAIDELGLYRVEEAERIIAETVELLLNSPDLAQNDIRLKKRTTRPPITFRWTHGKSHGGTKGLRFAMLYHARKPEEGATFKEYAALANEPMIGHYTGSRQDCYRVLAAHELAHWLQYSPEVIRPSGQYKKPHGTGFRKMYWVLRHALRSNESGQNG